MTRIGIPRALLYHQYFPMWYAFCQEIDLDVVVSPPTTQAMLAAGSSRVVADTCLPVKAYLGHVLSLVNKCDRIFIPAIRSVENNVYNCSKFLGLPDMTRAVVPEAPPILEIDIDINKGKSELYQQVNKLAWTFTKNPLRATQARKSAWQAYIRYRKVMSVEKVAPPEAIARICEGTSQQTPPSTGRQPTTSATIALVGHPYLLNDEHINHRIVGRLERSGVRVLTPEMVSPERLRAATNDLAGGAYWTYEDEVVGAGGYYLQNEADGVIGIMAFGCGPDSLMMDTVRRQAARLKTTPFMCLTLEEHTAEAGVVTRLEAFTDMLYRKKRKEAEICV
jgi:predicted nucleotide-binding protein (sugar kinase/HSP70/actin superfamily)